MPKVRDRSGSGGHFNSSLMLPNLRHANSMDELIPWLYLRVFQPVTLSMPRLRW